MNKIFYAILLGMLIGGMYVQMRFTGNLLSNKPHYELCEQQANQAMLELSRNLPTKRCADGTMGYSPTQ